MAGVVKQTSYALHGGYFDSKPATDRGAIPEVLGDAGLTFNPGDPADMVRVITLNLGDDDLPQGFSGGG